MPAVPKPNLLLASLVLCLGSSAHGYVAGSDFSLNFYDYPTADASRQRAACLGLKADAPKSAASDGDGLRSCQSKGQTFLPSGYRIDRQSCELAGVGTDPLPALLIDRAATQAASAKSDGFLGCLKQVNPHLAELYSKVVTETQPRIQCGGTDLGLRTVINHWCSGSLLGRFGRVPPEMKKACLKKTLTEGSLTYKTAAIVKPGFNKDLTLVGTDPLLPSAWPGTPKYRYIDLDEQIGSISSTIAHETLHLAGHSGYHDHDQNTLMPHIDDVYGCQGVCGSSKDPFTTLQLSLEGCLACARAAAADGLPRERCDSMSGPGTGPMPPTIVTSGDTPCSRREQNLCGSLPPAARARTLWHAFYLKRAPYECRQRLREQAALDAEVRRQFADENSKASNEYAAALDRAVHLRGWNYFNDLRFNIPGSCEGNLCDPCRLVAESAEFAHECQVPQSPDMLGNPLACLDKLEPRFAAAYATERATFATSFPDFVPKVQAVERHEERLRQRARAARP